MDVPIIGGLAPPLGVNPNFVNPPSNHLEANVILILCLAFTTPLVWLRLYTRLYLAKTHGLDDYCCFLAWLGFIGYCVIWWISSKHGAGVHQWDVPLNSLSYHAYLVNVQEIYYAILIFVAKLSILVLYLRLFSPKQLGRNKTYYAIHSLIWSNLLFYGSIVLLGSIGCLPRIKIFDPSIPGRCVNPHAVIISTAAVNFISDFAMLLVPQGRIWNLHLSKASKIGVSAIFMTGLFGCGTSIARLFISIQLSKTSDQTYVRAQDALWTYAEVTSAILVGVFPVLPRFFRHHADNAKAVIGKKHFDSRRTSFSRLTSSHGNTTSTQASVQNPDSYGVGSSEANPASKYPWESSRVLDQEGRLDFAFGDLASPLEQKPSSILRMV